MNTTDAQTMIAALNAEYRLWDARGYDADCSASAHGMILAGVCGAPACPPEWRQSYAFEVASSLLRRKIALRNLARIEAHLAIFGCAVPS